MSATQNPTELKPQEQSDHSRKSSALETVQGVDSEAGGIREEADCVTLSLEGERLVILKRYNEAIPYLEGALMLGTDDVELKGVIWSLLGTSHFQLGNYESAARCHMHDMATCKESGDEEGELKACCNFGIAMQMQGRLKVAGRSFLKYMEGCRKTNNQKGFAKACNNLGLLWKTQAKNILRKASESDTEGTEEVQVEAKQHIQRAIDYFQEYLEVVRAIGNKSNEGKAYGNLGICCELKQDFVKAVQWHEKRLELAKEQGDQQAESRAYCNIGNCKRGQGDMIGAIEFYLKDMELCLDREDEHGQTITARNLGCTYEALGDIDKCLEWHKKHLTLCQRADDPEGQLLALSTLASLYEDFEEPELALQHYKQQRGLLHELNDQEGMAQVHDSIRRLEEARGRPGSPKKDLSPVLRKRDKTKQSSLLKTMRRLKKGTIRLLFHKKDRHSVVTKAESTEVLQETPGPKRRSSIEEYATSRSCLVPSGDLSSMSADAGSLSPPAVDLDWDTTDHATTLLDQVLEAVDAAGIDMFSADTPMSAFNNQSACTGPQLQVASPTEAKPTKMKGKKKEQDKPRRSKNASKIYSQLFGGSRHKQEIEKQVISMKGEKGDGFAAPEVSAEWDNWMALSRELARCDSLQIDEALFES